MTEKPARKYVQTFGRKKTAIAVAVATPGTGLIKVNGFPLELVQPETLSLKLLEPINLLGRSKFADINIRIRAHGGGQVAQVYAIRQAISKAVIAWYAKYIDEAEKNLLRDVLIQYDRTLLVADPRRCEAKKFGGRGARARRQKSYR